MAGSPPPADVVLDGGGFAGSRLHQPEQVGQPYTDPSFDGPKSAAAIQSLAPQRANRAFEALRSHHQAGFESVGRAASLSDFGYVDAVESLLPDPIERAIPRSSGSPALEGARASE